MRFWIAATQAGLFVVAAFFAGWAATAREQKAAEQKITMMRTKRVDDFGRAAYLASAGFLVSLSAFLVASVLLIVS